LHYSQIRDGNAEYCPAPNKQHINENASKKSMLIKNIRIIDDTYTVSIATIR